MPGQPTSVVLDKGDDCALLKPHSHSNELIAVTTDTLNCGTHFLADIDPHALAYRALATNLSDLAAMGAQPSWFNLAISLPQALSDNPQWLAGFSQGLKQLSEQSGIYLVGGDTTSGPLSVTITAMGRVSEQNAMRRSQAQVGDLVCVTGTLGDAAGALQILLQQAQVNNQEDKKVLLDRFYYPSARYAFAQQLAQHCRCAIDISDGLLADLKHILTASKCGASIEVSQLPLSNALTQSFSNASAIDFALSGGDDYELCFTLPASSWNTIKTLAQQANVAVTCIGQICQARSLTLTQNGQSYKAKNYGYQHFI